MVSVTDALNHTTSTVFDAVGNAVVQIDAQGNRTSSAYDAIQQLVSTTLPSGGTYSYSYDVAGQMIASKDPLNLTTSYSYDLVGQRVATIDPLGYATTNVYDAAGNQLALVDASGNRTSWVYDPLNRVPREINPFGNATSFTYDAAGQLTEVIDPLGRKKGYGYDAVGQTITKSWYAAGTGTLLQTQTFAYDAAGQMTLAADPDGTYTMAYDAAGRVSTVKEPFNLTLTFTYDTTSNRTKVQDSLGGVTSSVYDAAGQLTSRQFSASGMSPIRFDYGYDSRGLQTSLTRYSDLAGTTKVGDTLNAFDTTGRLTNRQHRNGSNTILSNTTLAYDLGNRLTAKIENGTTNSYAYDAVNQVVKDGSAATLTYDATGNRTNSGYSTTTGNRMTSDGTWTYTYDLAGNVVKKSKGASAETWTYTYDLDNQLTSAEKRATDGGTLQAKVEYAYDAFGNRLSRKEYDGSLVLQSEERFAYDGWDTAKPDATGAENFDTWADLNGSNALTTRRLYGGQFDDLVARESSAGTIAWYGTDHQGSVRQIFDNSGAVVGTISYDAFGVRTTATGSIDRYGYTGREWDGTLGLQFNRARVYDPATARWYSADPMSFAAGDQNLYRYVGNFATGATDPSGYNLLGDMWDGFVDGIGNGIKGNFGNMANAALPGILNNPLGNLNLFPGLVGGAIGHYAAEVISPAEQAVELGFNMFHFPTRSGLLNVIGINVDPADIAKIDNEWRTTRNAIIEGSARALIPSILGVDIVGTLEDSIKLDLTKPQFVAGNGTNHDLSIFFEGAEAPGRILDKRDSQYGLSENFKTMGVDSGERVYYRVSFMPDNTSNNIENAYARAVAHHDKYPNSSIFIFAYSRGSVAAMTLAQRLQEKGIKVAFMGMTDPVSTGGVDMLDKNTDTIPDNVENAFIAGKKRSRPTDGLLQLLDNFIFPTTGIIIQDPKKTEAERKEYNYTHPQMGNDAQAEPIKDIFERARNIGWK